MFFQSLTRIAPPRAAGGALGAGRRPRGRAAELAGPGNVAGAADAAREACERVISAVNLASDPQGRRPC
jgi:hypothetical protein